MIKPLVELLEVDDNTAKGPNSQMLVPVLFKIGLIRNYIAL